MSNDAGGTDTLSATATKPEAAAGADAPTVAARVAPTEAHVGDPLVLTVSAIAPKVLPVNLPSVVELAPFSVLDRGESQQDLGDGRIKREFTLKIAAYETGALTVPAVEVTYLDKTGAVQTVRTAPVNVTVKSLIANEPEPALKENAPPVSVWKRELFWAYVGGGVAAAGVGGLLTWIIVRRMRNRVVVRPGPPPRPPHEIALERLDRLGQLGFLENADNRPFYFAVSEVIRDYLGARFNFDSLELTTAELVVELRRRAARELAPGHLGLGEIEGWLSACDLVKFAKISPTAAESRGALESAIRIVESTRPRAEPTAATTTTTDGTAGGASPPPAQGGTHASR